jgi:tetratricopeptide (TPR) repeat protein
MPRIFFGRDALLKLIVGTVLQGEHVALIGPGGIGKSSIAKALLHEELIIQKFPSNRYFVTYDGISSTAMSYHIFIDRLAEPFELSTRTSRAILSHLRSTNGLLILDNAETFLDATDEDAGRIGEVLAELGNLPSMHIVLTTRSTNLPSNFSPCAHIPIPGLDKESARQAFKVVYKRGSLDSTIDTLLHDLDFHPLSINLLAHVGSQSQWPVKRLVTEWQAQHTQILHTGTQKLQSLAVTINLSINSPSFQGFEEESMKLLRTVAFFSQGIRREDLPGLFPKVTDIMAIAETLSRCSLTYTRDGSLVMLAPIRIYVKDIYNSNLTYNDDILTDIRTYYIDQLKQRPEHCARHNYAHVERILAFDLSSQSLREHSVIRLQTLRNTSLLLNALSDHNPRTVELFPLIVAVSETVGSRWHLNPLASRKKDIIIAKGACLSDAGCLAYVAGSYNSSLQALVAATTFCKNHYSQCSSMLPLCLDLSGRVYMRQGRLELAESYLRESLATLPSPKDPVWVAELELAFAWLAIRRGDIGGAQKMVRPVENFYKSNNLTVGTVEALYCMAQISIEGANLSAAKRYMKEAIQVSDNQDRPLRKNDLLRNLADIVARQGKFAEANTILDEVSETASTRDTTLALQSKAWNNARLGNYDDARALIGRAADAVSVDQGRHLSSSSSIVAGYIELFAGELVQATRILQVLELALDDDGPDRRLRAWTLRALGELSLLQKDFYAAKEQFEKAWSICESMGVTPEHLYTCAWLHDTLPEVFNGWSTFLEGDL